MALRPPGRAQTTALCLLAGAALAVASVFVLAARAPQLSGYVMHAPLFAWLLAPYALAALLWLTTRAARASRHGTWIAAGLLAATLAAALFVAFGPRAGGDMVGLAFLLQSWLLCGGVIVGSAGLWLGSRLARRLHRPRA